MEHRIRVILSVPAKDLFDACRAKEIPHPWVQGIRDDSLWKTREPRTPCPWAGQTHAPPHYLRKEANSRWKACSG